MSGAERENLAREIAEAIKADLTGRGGLDGAWDSIDSDIQEEILDTWQEIVTEKLDEALT